MSEITLQQYIQRGLERIYLEQSDRGVTGSAKDLPKDIIRQLTTDMSEVLSKALTYYIEGGENITQEECPIGVNASEEAFVKDNRSLIGYEARFNQLVVPKEEPKYLFSESLYLQVKFPQLCEENRVIDVSPLAATLYDQDRDAIHFTKGIYSDSFISCKGFDPSAPDAGSGGITRNDLFSILSGEPLDSSEFINNGFLKIDSLLKDYATKDWVSENYLSSENDPTVPNWVKQITKAQVLSWDLVATLFDVDAANTYVYVTDNRGFVSNSFISCKGLDSSAAQIGGISEDDFSTLLFNILTGTPTEGQFINLAFLDLSSYVQKDWVNLNYATKTSLEEKANKTITLTAGNGLTGGGTLESNRTFALGTPSKITSKTTNAVTSESHTHEIDQASTSVVGIVKLYDALDSDSTILALTAKQGKAIGTRVVALEDMWENKATYLLAKNNRGIVSNSFISCKGLDETAPQVGGTFDRGSLFDILSGEPQNGESINLGYLDLSNYATTDFVISQGYITSKYLTGYATEQWVKQQGYLTQHQDLSAYAKSADVANTYATKVALQTLQNEHNALSTKVTNLDNLLNSDVSGVINTWGEVVDFLDEYSGSEDLATILAGMNNDIANRVLYTDFEKLEDSVSGIAGYFTNGSANNALKLGGQLPSYYATVDALNIVKNDVIAVSNRVKTFEDVIGIDSNGDVYIKGTRNFYTAGGTIGMAGLGSGGSGGGGTAGLGSVTVRVNGQDYITDASGIVTLPNYPSLAGYATEGYVTSRGYITNAALNGYAKLTDIPASLPASDVYAWAKAATKPTYTASEVGALSVNGGTITFAGLSGLTLKRTTQNSNFIHFTGGDADFGYLGFAGVGNPVYADYNGYVHTLIHTGNYADTTDRRYLQLSGGTLDGGSNQVPLTLNGTGDTIRISFRKNSTTLGYLAFAESNKPLFISAEGGKYPILHSGNYSSYALPLSGGTISSSHYQPLIINSTYSAVGDVRIAFSYNGGIKGLINWDSTTAFRLYNYISASYIGVKDDGTPVYNEHALIHSGNIGSQSVANADTLDGYHADGFAMSVGSSLLPTWVNCLGYGYGHNDWLIYGPALTFGVSTYYARIQKGYNDNSLYLSGWSSELGELGWREFAFTDSNVASATKLQTARTIWGQSFDGSGDVSGDFTMQRDVYGGSGNIVDYNLQFWGAVTGRGGIINCGINDGYGNFSHFKFGYDGDTSLLTILRNGNVLIGTTSDTGDKLRVYGSLRADGVITGTSAIKMSWSGASTCGLYPNNWITSDGVNDRLWLYNDAQLALYGSEIQLRNTTKVHGDLTVYRPGNTENLLIYVRDTQVAYQGYDSDGYIYHDFFSNDTHIARFDGYSNCLTVYNFINTQTIYTTNWVRSYNDTGWFNETYGGGIWMRDSDYVRVYNGKSFWCDGVIETSNQLVVNVSRDAVGPTNQAIVINSATGATSRAGWPGIGFHIPGITYATIKFGSDEHFYFFNYALSYLMPIKCGGMVAEGSLTVTGGATFGGDVYSEGTMAMARLASSSDAKLKENIKSLSADKSMGVVRALRPTEWNWKKDGTHSFGFIAQDVQPIVPEMVSSVNDTLRLEYNQLHAFEIGAIQHIDSEVEILKRRVNELENELKQYRRNA